MNAAMPLVTVRDGDVDAFFEPLGRCRDVDDFEKLNRIGEGTYGTVYRARDRATQRVVALKRVILHNEATDGFPITALREIKLLQRLRHPNCVQLLDVVVGRKRSSVFLVFEYCEHDLSLLLRSRSSQRHPFKESELKRIMLSVLKALDYLHRQNILHRDIKLSNILYDRYGTVKLADFGLARETVSRSSSDKSDSELTPKVVTLWYRAPELLLGSDNYTGAVDLWACGCIFAELLMREPLLPGSTDAEQLDRIFQMLGRPTSHSWPGMASLPNADKIRMDSSRYATNKLADALPDISHKGLDLIQRMLTYDPQQRITAREALQHPYFREKPFPQEASMMPTFPSIHGDIKPTISASSSKRTATYITKTQDNKRGRGAGY